MAGLIYTRDADLVNQTPVGADNPLPVTAAVYPVGATPLTSASGNVINNQAQASLAAVSGKTNYICGLTVSGGGSTAGLGVSVTVAGTIGGSIFFPVVAPAGAVVPMPGLQLTFSPPIPASAANVAIVATLPALGAGNLYAGIVIHGFRI